MTDHLFNALLPQLIMLSIIYTLVLVVIFLDLWAGVRKARQRAEFRSSFGYRKTIEKIARYYNALFVITAIDSVQMLAVWQLNQQTTARLPLLPLLTFAAAIFIGFIELKSIYEKNDQKEKAKMADAARLAGQILKDRDTQQIIAAIVEYMKNEKAPCASKFEPPVVERPFMADPANYDEYKNQE